MLLGSYLDGTEIKKYLFGYNREYLTTFKDPCQAYKSVFDIKKLPEDFKMPKTNKDFFRTLDSIMLVSSRVIRFCVDNGYKNISFINLPGTDYHWLIPKNTVKYDYKTRDVLFLDYSRKCKAYNQILGPTPVCLVDKTPLGDNFYRTDLSFGSSIVALHPLICIGTTTKEKIKAAGLTGCTFRQIFDKYDQLPDLRAQFKL
ncbi:hypothetical protein ACFS6H_07040 [Terrimonas rubra]|uniref:Uncharacterized protein n=1 Tax=Terrimonas rubra TaxID=1035890 RepID=A0ABW6A3W9_9BACT